MPELRQNMATKEWVIIATDRAQRPHTFVQPDRGQGLVPAYDADCPFCPGQEELELELLRMPMDLQQPWDLRVVQNKFPALSPTEERTRVFDGVRRSMTGVGHHEVVVETRHHNRGPALQSPSEVRRTLSALQIRGRTLAEDRRVEHVIYFKNHGPRAGSSLIHPHCQIIGLPVVPQQLRVRGEEARRYFDDTGDCVFCRMWQDEAAAEDRVVAESPEFLAFVPYAAYSPFHVWIVPKTHGADFLETPRSKLDELGGILHEVLRRLHIGLNDPDYNYVVRSAPVRVLRAEYLHWYVSVVPRVTRAAGFELGSGMFINTALPEHSAKFLREVELEPPPQGEGPLAHPSAGRVMTGP